MGVLLIRQLNLKIIIKTGGRMNYKNKAEYLFKQIFGKRYKNCEEQHNKKTKKRDLYLYGGDLVLQINDGGGISTITHVKNYRELYIYACGLYDMKMKKIQDFIKSC